MDRYICMQDCYYLHKHWAAGDTLPPELKPNKHFALNGVVPTVNDKPVLGAGDDPRSNKVMLAELAQKYGISLPSDTSRKEIYKTLKRAEDGATVANPEPEPVVQPAPEAKAKPIEPESRFSDMSPDDLQSMKNHEIADKVLRLYKKEVKHAGYSKNDLLKKALEIELGYYEKRKGARA